MISLFCTQWPSIGEGDDAGALERAGGRASCSPFWPDGDAAGGINAHDGVAGGGVLDELDGADVVHDGRGVGHADDGGETAGGRGA